MRCRRTGLRWRRLDHGLRVEGIRGGDRLDRRTGVDDLGHEPLVRVELSLVGGDVGAGALGLERERSDGVGQEELRDDLVRQEVLELEAIRLRKTVGRTSHRESRQGLRGVGSKKRTRPSLSRENHFLE